MAAVVIGFLSMLLWQMYTAPQLSVTYAAATSSRETGSDGQLMWVDYSIRDALNQCTIVKARTASRVGVFRSLAPPVEFLIKVVIENSGPLAAHNVRLTIAADSSGAVAVRSTPNVAIEHSRSMIPGHQPVDVVHIATLPPKTTAVITHTTRIDSTRLHAGSDFATQFRVPHVTSDELGTRRSHATPMRATKAFQLESQLGGSQGIGMEMPIYVNQPGHNVMYEAIAYEGDSPDSLTPDVCPATIEGEPSNKLFDRSRFRTMWRRIARRPG